MKITFSDEHIRVILAALESFERMKIGQFKTALEEVFPKECGKLSYHELLELEKPLKETFFPEDSPTSGPSILSEKAGDGRIAYEIQKTIEQYLALKESGGYFGNGRKFDGNILNPSGLPPPKIDGLDEMQYKDFWIDRDEVEEDYDNGEFEKIWDYAKSNMNLPKGEKMEIFEKSGGFSGYRGAFYIRVHKPRKPLDGSTF